MNRTSWSLVLAIGCAPLTGVAAEPIDFKRDIRPILSNNCFFCHGPDDKERKGGKDGLRLDTPEGILEDLGGYAAVAPGKADASEVYKRLITADTDEVMPPKKTGKQLSAREIDLVKRWIDSGAKYERHWSYEPPVKPAAPDVTDLARQWQAQPANPVDCFLLAAMARQHLRPQPEADRQTLARRLALDLTGLPPTPAEVDAFVADAAPDAYERYVDAQLRKPAFGEHWARMWLDLARYADSAGYPSDPGREIWAYRDWVVRAFNANMPFDRFTIEQIAGDLLPGSTDDQLIATAFHRNTMTQNEGGTSDEEFRVAAIVDRVNTTFAVWMGTSMACAQCHTHKYDPITIKEYFQFYAILNQSADADKKDESPLLEFLTPERTKQKLNLQGELAALEDKFAHPPEKWLAGLEAWQARTREKLEWDTPRPAGVAAASGAKAETLEDGAVLVRNGAETDTYTLALPLAAGKLSALRLETLPDGTLPGGGPGNLSGNFVLTRLQAELAPRKGTAHSGCHVRVEIPGKVKLLQLAEVQVFSGGKNIALKGRAQQSSQYADAAAGRAIDGNTDGDYHKGSVAHTAGGNTAAWWEVDLGSSRPVEKIVVWNRTDGGTGGRLKDWKVQVLNENRDVVWETGVKDPPPVSRAFSPGGPVAVEFQTALATFTQQGFDAADVLKEPEKADAKALASRGWAIAGGSGKEQTLTLLTANPVEITEGSTLRLTLEQQSRYARHTLGKFRVSVTGDARAAQRAVIPPPVLAALAAPTPDDAQRRQIADYYAREVAPEAKADRQKLAKLKKQLADFKANTVPVMRELAAKDRRVTNIQLRGNWQNLGDAVEPGTPSAFPPLPAGAQADRLAMARWLVDRGNPLTARVTVNRFWEHLFGTGIVRSSEEFGAQGDLPTHPELLDWLAVQFMDSGWDMKAFLKMLVMTRAYRQSAKTSPEAQELDPDNVCLARGPRFRPTGEMLRDQALFVAGLLSPKMYGPPVRPLRPALGLNTAFGGGNDWQTSDGEDKHRRSLYTEVKRNSPYPAFTTFDATNREVCTIRRSRTNTPLQAFVTLNDPVFVEAAQGLARRIVEEGGADDAGRFRFAFRVCMSREPSAVESQRLGDLLNEARAAYARDADAATKLATDPLGPLPKDMTPTELAAWTTVANVIMNLDEFLMRR